MARIFASSNLTTRRPQSSLLPAPTPRSTPAWFCTSCCHFDGCFHFFVVFAIGLLRRFLNPILDPLAFVPNTFYTHHLSKYGLFQSLSQYGLFQNPSLHTCFGLNLNRGLNKTNAFASKPSFTQRAVLHKNRVMHKHHVLLAGPVQGLFAAYRIALSMVAGGTRRRRSNIDGILLIFQ